jgi:putative DNA primase/helicase
MVLRYTQCPLEEESKEDPVALFSELVDVLSNHNKPIGEYMTNWLAHILQKPFNNPLTSLILSGRKGCGKDTLGDFIQEWVIGDRLSHNYTSTDQFWDKYDTDRLNKLFIKLEEASGSVNKQHIGDMKSRITSRTLTVNPKGQKSITSANYCRYFMTTNEGECVKVEDGERRFFVVACGKDWVKNIEQWKKVRRVLFNDNGARKVGEWLMARDLSNYDTTVFPENEYLMNLMESSKSSTELFIEELGVGRYTGAQLWDAYRMFVVSKELVGIETNTAFGRSLHIPIRDGLIIKKREVDGIVYIKK